MPYFALGVLVTVVVVLALFVAWALQFWSRS